MCCDQDLTFKSDNKIYMVVAAAGEAAVPYSRCDWKGVRGVHHSRQENCALRYYNPAPRKCSQYVRTECSVSSRQKLIIYYIDGRGATKAIAAIDRPTLQRTLRHRVY